MRNKRLEHGTITEFNVCMVLFHHYRLLSQICPHLGLSGLGLPLVHCPAGVHSGTGVAADPPGQNRVPAPMPLLGRFLVSLCHLTQSETDISLSNCIN